MVLSWTLVVFRRNGNVHGGEAVQLSGDKGQRGSPRRATMAQSLLRERNDSWKLSETRYFLFLGQGIHSGEVTRPSEQANLNHHGVLARAPAVSLSTRLSIWRMHTSGNDHRGGAVKSKKTSAFPTSVPFPFPRVESSIGPSTDTGPDRK